MIDYDYVMSKPLSEKEQKEVENLFKIKKPKKKYKILVYPNIKSKNDFLKESDNGFEVKDLELRKEELKREKKEQKIKTYKITDKEVANLELQKVTITPLIYTYKDMSDRVEVKQGIKINIKKINQILNNNDLKNLTSDFEKIENQINYYMNKQVYHNNLYCLFNEDRENWKKLYRIIIKKDKDINNKDIYSIQLQIIEVKDLKNGLYFIGAYIDNKKIDEKFYEFNYQTYLGKEFNYEKLLEFLKTNKYKVYSKDKKDEIKKELINIIKELGFEEYQITPYEVKGFDTLEEDLGNNA